MRLKKWIVRGFLGLLAVCLVLVGVSALVNRNRPTHSTVVERLSEAEKALLAEFFQVRQQLGDVVWPGWDTAVIPVIVYNESYAFLLGYPNPPDGWLKVPQNQPRGGPWELVADDTFNGEPYYRQPLPADGTTPQAFTVRVGDQWVASMTTMEWTEISLANQFEEELPPFLVPIFPYGLAAAETAVIRTEAKYPWNDATLQDTGQTELDLLAAALEAETESQAITLAQQFLAQRQARREDANLPPAQANYERQREWLEGLARYVELEIWRQASLAEEYEPVTALLDDPDFAAYANFDRRWSQEIDQIGRMADDEGDGRFYYSGMAQAVLLDQLLPNWKEQALDEAVFLEDLLETAVTSTTAQSDNN